MVDVVHGVTERDWPDVSRLIQRERSGQFDDGTVRNLANAPPAFRSAVTLETIPPGRSGRVVMLSPTDRYVQDVYVPHLRSFRLRIGPISGRPDEQIRVVQPGGVDTFVEALAESSLSSAVSEVQVGVGRWKVVYHDSMPERVLYSDSESVRVSLSDQVATPVVHWAMHDFSQAIPRGTLVQIDHSRNRRSWIITAADFMPDEDAGMSSQRIDHCRRQSIRAGDSEDCDVCLPGDTPLQLQVGGSFLQEVWDEMSRLLGEELESPDVVDPTLLEHREGCKWQSDDFFDGRFYWELELHQSPGNPPQAVLRLAGNETIYGQRLEIIYWSQYPFCALSSNQMLKIVHASQETDQVPRTLLPGCLTVSPYAPPCFVLPPEERDRIAAYDCVRNWQIRIFGSGENDFTWQAGPRSPLEDIEAEPDSFGCKWPGQERRLTFAVVGDQTLGSGWFNAAPPADSSFAAIGSFPSGIVVSVRYAVRITGNNSSEWRLSATVQVDPLPFPSNAQGRPLGTWEYSRTMVGPLAIAPECSEEFVLTYSGSAERPSGLPDEITIRPSEVL